MGLNHSYMSCLNALEELLFKMLGMGREDIVKRTLSAKEIGYGKTTLLKA